MNSSNYAGGTEIRDQKEATTSAEGDWYYEAVRFVRERGLMNGYGDGRLGPREQATRAQVAQMLKSFIENQEETT